MDEIAQIIETALSTLNLNTDRIIHQEVVGRKETDPYIVYSQVTKTPNLFADDIEQSRGFYIDVDIYTTDVSKIDITSKSVEEKLTSVGFLLMSCAGTIIEDEQQPIWYHEPLEFYYEKELN